MAQLIVDRGGRSGERLALERKQPCTVGSATDCTLRLEDPGVAPHHAVIKALKATGFGVKALDGTVTVNGQRAGAARLEDGDMLELGAARLRFSLAPASEGTQIMIDGFKLLEVIGKGGMGTVYRAEQVSLGRQVAVKVLSKDLTSDPVFVARFVAEARAAARLDHPNVVKVFDVDHEGDTYFYSMELMHEGSLERQIRSRGKLPEQEALAVIADAARGLSYANSLRIVHRDIKPDNLMLDQHGHVKIADLGLAMTDEDDVGKIAGTPHFMSPEQVLRKRLDHRSDLYALGCTFYRLVTGRTPFRGTTVKAILRAQVKEAPEPAEKVDPEISGEVSAIISKLLQKAPDQRYASADELLEDLEAVLAPPTRKGALIAGTAGALLIAGAALAWGLTRPEGKTQRVVQTVENPANAKLVEEIRQLRAEIALLQVRAGKLSGSARAEAFDRVGREHAGMKAATSALAEAKRIRHGLATTARLRRERQRRIAKLVADLETAVHHALTARDFAAAMQPLATDAVPAELRSEKAITQARTALRAEVKKTAQQQIAAYKKAIETAQGGSSLASLDRALAKLASILDRKTGWPRDVLVDAEPLGRYLAAAKERRAQLEKHLHAKLLEQSWKDYKAGLFGADGVLSSVHAFDLAAAAAAAEALQKKLQDWPAGGRAAHLAAAARQARGFLELFAAAAATGKLHYLPPGAETPVAITGFSTHGEQAGLLLKEGPRIRPHPRLIPLGELHGEELRAALRAFEGGDPLARSAFSGLMSLSECIDHAAAYIADISPSDEDSGTGAQAFLETGESLHEVAARLEGREEPWAKVLASELSAAEVLVQGLRALSKRRNLTAAGHLEQLVATYPQSCVVQRFR